MSFEDILASMGEAGELGENPRLSLDTGEAKEGRIRPGTGDAGEQFASNRPAFAQPNPAPINEIRPIRPIRPSETEKGIEYTLEDVAELDRLIVRLCQLEPWLADALPEMQAARRRMAPVNLAESLELFRGYVQAAERKTKKENE